MKSSDPAALTRYQQATKQKPTMTPPEWRAAGWKAAPTRNQMFRPLDGICYLCKPIVRAKYGRYPVKPVFVATAVMIIALAITVYLLTARGQ